MPRIIDVTTDPGHTDDLLRRLDGVEGLVGVTVNRGTGVLPPSDHVRISATNLGARRLAAILTEPEELGILSLTSIEPRVLLSPAHQDDLDRESSEAPWPDVGGHLREESNAELNILLLMFLSGAIAATGIATDVVHIVVGAMVVTPGFEPLLRIPFGLIVGSHGSLKQALLVTVTGYLLMAAGAGVAYLLLEAVGASRPFGSLQWLQYWSTTGPASITVAVIAGLAGAVTVTANRSVFTAGVMIALALVPGMALVGIGLAAGELSVAADGAVQWAVNGVAVLVTATIVIGLKHLLMHGRATTA